MDDVTCNPLYKTSVKMATPHDTSFSDPEKMSSEGASPTASNTSSPIHNTLAVEQHDGIEDMLTPQLSRQPSLPVLAKNSTTRGTTTDPRFEVDWHGDDDPQSLTQNC